MSAASSLLLSRAEGRGPMSNLVLRRTVAILTTTVLICWVVGLRAEPAAAAGFDRQIAITERTTYGLPADDATLDALSAGGVDVGTPQHGFPLTAEEDRRLDLNGRVYFADRVSRNLMPFVEALPTYAGAYIDQLDEGSLVVLLTSVDPATIAAIQARAPDDDRRRVRVVTAEHSAAALSNGLKEVRAAWTTWASEVSLISAGLDFQRNSLYVRVVAHDVPAAQSKSAVLAERVGVPIDVLAGQPTQEIACLSRDNCHTPFKAGIRVRPAGFPDNDPDDMCTMGFHIVDAGDEQWLTAAHCGCLYGHAIDWRHNGFGVIGREVATLWNKVGDNIDIATVQMNDAQRSQLIYSDSGDMLSPRNPIQGETIKVSRGKSNVVQTGTVTHGIDSWTSGFCGVTMAGADSSLTGESGDSGSPIYRRWSADGTWFFTPIGILDTAVGEFGFVKAACDFWGATIYGA